MADTLWQIRMIRLVASHGDGFATPAHAGGVWVYSLAVDEGSITRLDLVRQYCATSQCVRAALGY